MVPQLHKDYSPDDLPLCDDGVSMKANWTPPIDVFHQVIQSNDKIGALLQSYADSRTKKPHEWLANQPEYSLKEVFPDSNPQHYSNELIAFAHCIKRSAKKIVTEDIINMAKVFVISETPDAQPINLLDEAKRVIYSGSGISIAVIQKKLCFFAYNMNIGSGKPTLKSISQRVARDLCIKLSPGLVLYINGHCCKKEMKDFKDE